MKTAYGRLVVLAFFAIVCLLLLAPMRSGNEDQLYTRPLSIRMNVGDSYDAIRYTLDAPGHQAVRFRSANAQIASVDDAGKVNALAPGKTQIHLIADGGAKAAVDIEVVSPPAVDFALNTSSLSMEKGDVTGLSVEFAPGTKDQRVEWISDDESVATVDTVGRVVAVGGGTTLVSAVTPSGQFASAEVYVHVSGKAIRITPDGLMLGSGSTIQLSSYYLPTDTTDEISGWHSSDDSVLTVDDNGTVHAVGEGRAIISVYSKDGLSNSSIINVAPAARGFEVSPATATIERGSELDLDAHFLDEDWNVSDSFSGHYILWTSSDPSVASVDNGHVTALKSGNTRISASADGKTAVCDLRVVVIIREITLNMTELTVSRENMEKPIQLTPTFWPENPDNPQLTYLSSNELVAKADSNGLVTLPGGYGTAVITALADSGAEAQFTINVVASPAE